MSYTPTLWKTGDVITAERLNKLEQGVQNEQVGPQGPPGADGQNGKDGAPGADGAPGKDGTNGTDGKDATINGQNAVQIVAGDNISIDQTTPGVLKISATGGGGGGIPLESIEITTPPNKTEYTAGETFESTGMVVTANYGFGLSQPITGYTISPSGELTGDVTEITVSYSENGVVKTAKQAITVNRIQATITLDPKSVSLDADTRTTQVTVQYNGDGELTAEIGNAKLVQAELQGSTLTVTSLGETSETVAVTVNAPQTGKYTAASAELTVENYQTVHVFGVSWDTTNPSTELVRLTSETDPNGIVTNTVSTEPQPAVGTGLGSSPFDAFAPWNGMEQYNIIDGAVSYKRGDPGFSQAGYDTVVYIPPFYFRREQSGDNQLFYVGDGPFDGAELHPGSGKYISRYIASSEYRSMSGKTIAPGTTQQNNREGFLQAGNGLRLWDISIHCAMQLLYIVEYAHMNSQEKIGPGADIATTGATDSMQYHTGQTDSGVVQYRNVEGAYGCAILMMDGILTKNLVPYVSTDYLNYNSDADGYINTGVTLNAISAGFSGQMIYTSPKWLTILTGNLQSSSTTYTCDGGYYTEGNNFPYCAGGNSSNGDLRGIFFFASNAASFTTWTCRGMYIPEVVQ